MRGRCLDPPGRRLDPPGRQVRLYVDGHLEVTRPRTGMVRASGALDIGRALERGKPLDQWHGAVDDVRIYGRPLTGHQVGEVLAART
ncbi:MAG TPA: LamG-like jellyroll fold domain-containing protein [Actinoallomurus sp.]|nr:LamG-like jellyroll fold domain-containing protein [Actinoallomurus sp.]